MLIESIGGDRFLWGINELQYLEHSEALAVFSAKAGLVQKVQHGGTAAEDNRTVPLSPSCSVSGYVGMDYYVPLSYIVWGNP